MATFDDFISTKGAVTSRRPLGTCEKCHRQSVPMAKRNTCETCYGQSRPGRSGRTKDQNLLIKQFYVIVAAYQKIGMDDDEIAEDMQRKESYFDSVRDYLIGEASTKSTLLRGIFSADVDRNPIESTVDENSIESTSVDPDRTESTDEWL